METNKRHTLVIHGDDGRPIGQVNFIPDDSLLSIAQRNALGLELVLAFQAAARKEAACRETARRVRGC